MELNKYSPVIWQLSIIKFLNGKTLITGVILQKSPAPFHKKSGFFKNFIHVVSSYFKSAYKNKDILIKLTNQTKQITTNTHGGFQIILDFHINEDIAIYTQDNQNIKLKSIQNYPITFSEHNESFSVISDVDDTIIKSFTTNNTKRINSILFTPPQKRQAIKFTAKFFEALKENHTNFYCVSKSESNLFSVLNSFIQFKNNLPKPPLFLTPYLNLKQLIFNKKTKGFKEQTILNLLKLTHQKFILVGDDSQKDMLIYFNIAKMFPERILKIYIRQTQQTKKTYQNKMWQQLQTLQTPTLYFNNETKLDYKKEILELKSLAL